MTKENKTKPLYREVQHFRQEKGGKQSTLLARKGHNRKLRELD